MPGIFDALAKTQSRWSERPDNEIVTAPLLLFPSFGLNLTPKTIIKHHTVTNRKRVLCGIMPRFQPFFHVFSRQIKANRLATA
jgi:hypothetical protein